jgi:indoleamine 2,3-dioxygenase
MPHGAVTAGFDAATIGARLPRGFLPRVDPATELPAGFSQWDEIARDLPKLIVSARVRDTLETLPVLDVSALEDERHLRRAMLVLSYFGHAAVWGGTEPMARIPAGVAVPWHTVAQRLGRPPVLSYASYALDNWRRLDCAAPVALGNLALLQHFLAGADEEWFITVHIDIEARATPALWAVARASEAAERGDDRVLGAALGAIASALEGINQTLDRMPEWCDPYIYFARVRPFIHGWKDHPALPDGVVYEGVAAWQGRPRQFRGESGAQSSIVPALDAVLGVEHRADPLRTYLMEMRDYMPPPHRAFLQWLESRPPVRDRMTARPGTGLAARYDACVEGLRRFRDTHLQFAARYIHQQGERDAANPNQVGTGGTPFMRYLAKHRDETAAHRLQDRS